MSLQARDTLTDMKIAGACCGLLTFAVLASAQAIDLTGKPANPFATTAHARVFLFVRTDCPLTNRYAPELERIASEFANRGVDFWLVYPDPARRRTQSKITCGNISCQALHCAIRGINW